MIVPATPCTINKSTKSRTKGNTIVPNIRQTKTTANNLYRQEKFREVHVVVEEEEEEKE